MIDTSISQAPQFFVHTEPAVYYRLSADGGVSKWDPAKSEWVWSAWGHLDPVGNRAKFQKFDSSMSAIDPESLPAEVVGLGFEGSAA